jgi:hypothetical protein
VGIVNNGKIAKYVPYSGFRMLLRNAQ